MSQEQRQARATQALRKYNTELDSIQRAHRRRIQNWQEDRKEWELKLVFKAWDSEFAKFPPYVTKRSQLGYRLMDIPQAYVDKPAYQSNHYCGICLESMPLICHVCRDDINEQQQTSQMALAQHKDKAIKNARKADLASAHLLNSYHPLHLVPDSENEFNVVNVKEDPMDIDDSPCDTEQIVNSMALSS